MALPRRTLTDLAARYALEPTLRDVFVEGSFDKDVLTECFATTKSNERAVYHIDSVDVSEQLLRRHGLTNGNKNRVIALAKELASIPSTELIRCIIDRDTDHWFGSLDDCPRLRWTEYCTIELYFLCDEIMRSLLLTSAGIRVSDWKQLMRSTTTTLKRLYAARLAERSLKWTLNWPPATKLLEVSGDTISIDWNKFQKRLLNANGKHKDSAEFETLCGEWFEKISGCDARYCIRGHDFIAVLAWVVRALRGHRVLATEEAIQRSLLLLVARAPRLSELAA
jgi:hypothetical protein